ncbi:MAG: FAD-dependent oxidoreductase [Planctomycetales bacterium]
MRYDLLILGTEPAGLHAAFLAAHAGRRVALISSPDVPWPVSSETICQDNVRPRSLRLVYDLPQILLNQPLLLPTLAACRGNFGKFAQQLGHLWRVDQDLQQGRLREQGVDCFQGTTEILAAGRIRLTEPARQPRDLSADRILIAADSEQRESHGLRTDGLRIVTADQMVLLPELPKRILVVGGGMTGMAWTEVLSRLGHELTVIDSQGDSLTQRGALLARPLADGKNHGNYRLLLGHDAIGADVGRRREMVVTLDCGVKVHGDLILLAHGRRLKTDAKGLKQLGVLTDEQGRLWCNDQLQTWEPSLLAIGQSISYLEPWRYSLPLLDRILLPDPLPAEASKAEGSASATNVATEGNARKRARGEDGGESGGWEVGRREGQENQDQRRLCRPPLPSPSGGRREKTGFRCAGLARSRHRGCRAQIRLKV